MLAACALLRDVEGETTITTTTTTTTTTASGENPEEEEDASRGRAGAGGRGGEVFGVVSTASTWKEPLENYIRSEHVLGEDKAMHFFRGVETCGLTAGELHDAPAEEVEARVKDATGRLVAGGAEGQDGRGKKRVGIVVLGCAGMVGMEGWVRDVLGGGDGEGKVEGVRVVDGVRAGVGMLQGLVRGGF